MVLNLSLIGFRLVLSWSSIGPRLFLYLSSIGPLLILYWSSICPLLVLNWSLIGPQLDLYWSPIVLDWFTLFHFGPLLSILVNFGPLWSPLVHFGISPGQFDYPETYNVIPVNICVVIKCSKVHFSFFYTVDIVVINVIF